MTYQTGSANAWTRWKTIESWLSDNAPGALATLNPGATDDSLRKLEEGLEIKLPEDFRDFYKIHDGQGDDGALDIIFGLRLLPLNEIDDQWTQWWRLLESEGEWVCESDPDEYSSHPEERVKLQYINPLWIPITHDSSGNHIGIDLGPDRTGTVGQIINFGRDENDKHVLADNFGEFIDRVLAEIELDNVYLESGLRSGRYCMYLRRAPQIEHFDHIYFLSGSQTHNASK